MSIAPKELDKASVESLKDLFAQCGERDVEPATKRRKAQRRRWANQAVEHFAATCVDRDEGDVDDPVADGDALEASTVTQRSEAPEPLRR